MAKLRYKINSILGGHSDFMFATRNDQFEDSEGIDPDRKMNSTANNPKASGVITQSGYDSVSGSNVNAPPVAVVTNPKDERIYVVLTNGRIVSYSSVPADETLEATTAGGNASGAAYYNNYIYIFGTGADSDDVSRYGPLDGTASLADGVWTGSTLGSQTALTDTDYFGTIYPNHWGHVHSDNQLYFTDFKDGQGLIHSIKTKKGTDEGDADDNSAYNVLDLPFGYYPTDIESYGTDLVISSAQSTSASVVQGSSAIFFWDTISDSFYRKVDIPFHFASALLNNNGRLYVFAGQRSCAVMQYVGGFTLEQLNFLETAGSQPPAGAVSSYGEKIAWGSNDRVYTLNYKSGGRPRARHCIAVSSLTNDPQITALKFAQTATGEVPRVVMGAKDDVPEYTVDSLGSGPAIFKSRTVVVGQRFRILKIRFPLSRQINSSTNITPTVTYDNGDFSQTLDTINDTNYDTGTRTVTIKEPTLADESWLPQHNFRIDFSFGNANDADVLLPIEIIVDTIED